jgi:hypothetical protein
MWDVAVILIVLAFFGASVALVTACERLRGGGR